MPRIRPVDPATAGADAAPHLATTRRMFGSIPNLFATAANAPAALAAMNGFFASLAGGSLGAQVGERIAVAVAEANRCGYCLSAHTAIGKMAGLDAAQLAAARRGHAEDGRIEAILRLALAINASHGRIGEADLDTARRAGISDAEIVETVAHVALSIFTNSLNNVSGTEIDFPVVALAAA